VGTHSGMILVGEAEELREKPVPMPLYPPQWTKLGRPFYPTLTLAHLPLAHIKQDWKCIHSVDLLFGIHSSSHHIT
jgi:hypothetical protein